MRLLTLLTSTLSVLTACELPSKLGDLPDDQSTTGTSDATGGKTSDQTTTATDGEPQTTSTGDPQTTGEPEPSTTTTGPITGAESTGQGSDCDGLDESSCLAAFGCDAYYGTAYDFEGCMPGQNYLGCGPILDCDQAFTTVCRDGTDEVYLVPTSCHPAGFSQCDEFVEGPCGGDCGALDESACAVENDFCNPIYGNKHVEQDGEICVEQSLTYIACISMDGVCPPVVPTVCSTMDPAEKYDIPSGCIVPGFEQCDPEGAQPCQ
jgi:hypothetical protein